MATAGPLNLQFNSRTTEQKDVDTGTEYNPFNSSCKVF